MQTGIYIIQNTINRKCYVGSALNIRSRWSDHCRTLRRGTHRNPHLQASWTKHGEAAFKFWVAEECKPEVRIEREQWWLDMFRPVYNILRKAASPEGRILSQETKAKIARSHIGKCPPGMADFLRSLAAEQKGRPLTPEHVKALREASAESRKTHCPQGHPYDEKNTHRSKKGHRSCRACGAISARKRRAAK